MVQLTLDDVSVLSAIHHDPQGFLAALDGLVIIDEIQRAPELFVSIKAEVDRNRQPGRYLLTGSANVLLLPKLSIKEGYQVMGKFALTLIGVFLLAGLNLAYTGSIHASGLVNVYFSPNGGATEAIVTEINKAHREVLVQAYSFTSTPIAKALLAAHKRGVKVQAVLDKSQRKEKYTAATFLANAGIPVAIDDRHAIAHNKIMIIDRTVLITGSFNFTKAAEEKNAENLLVIKDNPQLVEKYLANFEAHKSHSEPYIR